MATSAAAAGDLAAALATQQAALAAVERQLAERQVGGEGWRSLGCRGGGRKGEGDGAGAGHGAPWEEGREETGQLHVMAYHGRQRRKEGKEGEGNGGAEGHDSWCTLGSRRAGSRRSAGNRCGSRMCSCAPAPATSFTLTHQRCLLHSQPAHVTAPDPTPFYDGCHTQAELKIVGGELARQRADAMTRDVR